MRSDVQRNSVARLMRDVAVQSDRLQALLDGRLSHAEPADELVFIADDLERFAHDARTMSEEWEDG